MDPDPRISFFAVILLVYLASWFAVTETALASVSKSKLKAFSEHGDYRADDALYALDNFDRAITTLLICTNIVHISAASIVTVQVTRIFGVGWVSLSTFIMTLIVFFFGEMLPKSIAKNDPEKYSLSHSSLLNRLIKILWPLSSLLASIGDIASRITKSEPEVSVTEDELFDLIDDLEEEGTLEEDESDLIQSAIEFGDQKLANIYTPRTAIAAIDVDWSPKQIIDFIKEQSHSRLPVYQGNIDNIIGIVQYRDYIKAYLDKGDATDIRSLLTQPLFLRNNYHIDNILSIMAEHRYSLAIVKANDDSTIGLVSMEDILEELVGEIWDEDDVVGGAQ